MQNSLESYLESADGAAKVIAHARLLVKLARLYQELAPPHLGQASRLVNYKSGTVVIHASSGAIATKLRQLAPSLTDGFSNRGVECNGVQVKVQVRETGRQSRTSTPKPLSAETTGELARLRDALPGSPLRDAIGKLLERSSKVQR
jgi:hypothetical protein